VNVNRRVRALLPVAVLATGGCLATRSDVEKLQLSVNAMRDTLRAQQDRSDAANRELIRSATEMLGQQFTRQFTALSDSVRQVSSSLQRVQGDLTLSMNGIRTQMVALEEGLGASQKRIADLRTTVEAAATPPVVTPPAPGAAPTGTAAQAPASGAPPAAVLWNTGYSAFIRRATASARDQFQLLVDNYPTHDRAPEAQFYIAVAYADEGNRTAADSVYGLVVTKYPNSDKAPSALWKRAKLAQDAGNAASTRALLQQIVDKYPRSDERSLAEDELKRLKQP
jgi:tol-pal system protein YbgF